MSAIQPIIHRGGGAAPRRRRPGDHPRRTPQPGTGAVCL